LAHTELVVEVVHDRAVNVRGDENDVINVVVLDETQELGPLRGIAFETILAIREAKIWIGSGTMTNFKLPVGFGG
jgi:hypothetical protein